MTIHITLLCQHVLYPDVFSSLWRKERDDSQYEEGEMGQVLYLFIQVIFQPDVNFIEGADTRKFQLHR